MNVFAILCTADYLAGRFEPIAESWKKQTFYIYNKHEIIAVPYFYTFSELSFSYRWLNLEIYKIVKLTFDFAKSFLINLWNFSFNTEAILQKIILYNMTFIIGSEIARNERRAS